MEIDRTQVETFIGDILEDVSKATYATHSHSCPHCDMPVRYRTIARQQDIEDFQQLMETAYRVMDACGITANLLSMIKAECYIEIARRNSRKENRR
jgi:hypothetical protein